MDESAQVELARDYLDALMADYILHAGAPVKTADVAREIEERLGASARLVRNELTRSQRLTLIERRWDLRSRHERRRRSVDGAVRTLLRQAGRPLGMDRLTQELALHLERDHDAVQRAVDVLIATRETYFKTADGQIGLREWLLDVQDGDDDDSVRRYNFFRSGIDLDDLLDRLDLVAAKEADTDLDALLTLVRSAEEPVANRLALYALWHARGTHDLPAVFEAALEDERLLLLPGPAWATPAYEQEVTQVIHTLSEQQTTDVISAEPVDLEAVLAGDVMIDEDFELAPSDVDELQKQIQDAGTAQPLENLVSDVFELFAGDLQYTAAVKAVHDALAADERFVALPDHRWHLRVLLPPTLYRVPATLQLSPIVVMRLAGEPVDVQLTDAGLDGGLQFEVRAPDLEDVGEEHEVSIPAGIQLASRQRFVTSYRHFVSGTVKVRKIDRGVFATEPPVKPLSLTDADSGDPYTLWLNNDTGLLCGLDDWYKDRLHPTGHVFYLEKLDDDALRASADDQPDALLMVPQSRLDELLVLRVKVEHAPETSILDIMQQLIKHYEQGVSFRRLYTECNVVRRVAKRTIAGNLSAYPMFSLNDDETLWLYDERKANRPMKPEKAEYLVKSG